MLRVLCGSALRMQESKKNDFIFTASTKRKNAGAYSSSQCLHFHLFRGGEEIGHKPTKGTPEGTPGSEINAEITEVLN